MIVANLSVAEKEQLQLMGSGQAQTFVRGEFEASVGLIEKTAQEKSAAQKASLHKLQLQKPQDKDALIPFSWDPIFGDSFRNACKQIEDACKDEGYVRLRQLAIREILRLF